MQVAMLLLMRRLWCLLLLLLLDQARVMWWRGLRRPWRVPCLRGRRLLHAPIAVTAATHVTRAHMAPSLLAQVEVKG